MTKITPQTTLSDIQKWLKKNGASLETICLGGRWEATITIWEGDVYTYFMADRSLAKALTGAIEEAENDKKHRYDKRYQ